MISWSKYKPIMTGPWSKYKVTFQNNQKLGPNDPCRLIPTKLMKNLGYGKGYEKYTQEDLLPEKIKHTQYLKI